MGPKRKTIVGLLGIQSSLHLVNPGSTMINFSCCNQSVELQSIDNITLVFTGPSYKFRRCCQVPVHTSSDNDDILAHLPPTNCWLKYKCCACVFPFIMFCGNLSKESLATLFPYFLEYCSTTGKPTRSFATERVSLDSV